MRRQRYEDDDDDAFEWINGKQVLKDKRSFRVGLADSLDPLQRAVARHAQRSTRIVDGNGDSGLALNKPGYRLGDQKPRRTDFYDEYDAIISREYLTGAGSKGPKSREGDPCTCRNEQFPESFGAPGHLQGIDGQLVCVPDRMSGSEPADLDDAFLDEREKAYQEHDFYLQNAWRKSQP
jgi:hypothetical protein